ncbi:hypothetical protein BV25DRAFT_1875503 [Artomyces pyxidatus]|uniref:Uncharacterized protein n=1 Tax=Artomyces pyxidatus TaxID=48021 RepID=A0ACB8TID7_9AGAM|nr:hypothetical protein BV25DRAFT_1875503 [Artomyces pyxidatus]
MAERLTGVLAWTASIRTAMMNDPGRQLFEDQIQTQGFLFLDEYLDNILAQNKQDGVIVDLLKTPGRRRDAPKKTRSAVAAAARAQAFTISLEVDEDRKENIVPVNSFHKALLQAKDSHEKEGSERWPSPHRQTSVSLAESPPARLNDGPQAERDDLFIEIMSSSPQPFLSSLPEMEEDGEQPPPQIPIITLAPSQSDPSNELSVIAEDDEPAERSRGSVHPLPSSPAAPLPPPPTREAPPHTSRAVAHYILEPENDELDAFHDSQMDTDEFTQATAITVSDSTHTFHSVTLTTSPRPIVPTPLHEAVTEPLPKVPHAPVANIEREAATLPLLTLPTTSSWMSSTTDLSVPLRDHDPSESGLSRKPSLSQFPSLPAPSPLRKSTRLVREPSIGTSLAPAAVPAPASKRTSWLTKAREAKALEVNLKRASVVNAGLLGANKAGVSTTVALASGTKRKSGDMLTGMVENSSGGDEDERKYKLPKISADITEALYERMETMDGPADLDLPVTTSIIQLSTLQAPPADIRATKSADDVGSVSQEGVLNLFKKTVEDLGARVGKSMGKSLGGNAANELAEARAAAQARVAERHKLDADQDRPSVRPSFSAPTLSLPEKGSSPQLLPPQPPVARDSDKRLSVSDLVSGHDYRQESASRIHTFNLQPTFHSSSDISTSTTPPNSPPPVRQTSFIVPHGPVFNRPPPVFVPPPSVQAGSSEVNKAGEIAKEYSFKLPTSSVFPLRPPFNVGLQPSMPSSSKLSSPLRQPPPLSGQSTQASIFSDGVFDSQNDVPAWAPRTQDTEYTSQESLVHQEKPDSNMDDLDDDDSWRMDDKFAASNQMWTPFGATNGVANEEDSMTWSTVPSQSQRGGDTGLISQARAPENREEDLASLGQTGAYDMAVDDVNEHAIVIETGDDGWERDITDAVKPVSKLDPASLRSQSQLSMASSSGESSQPGGFFGQATKLVSSMLGVSKKGKAEPLKSIQMAAAAAKKHQEEQDKKATRLREMEARRQAALQRKAEEEKAKVDDEEKRLRDEADRRKKEREEHTGKRPLKVADQKTAEEDNTKKRKMVVEIKTKPPSREKPPSKEKDKKEPAPSRAVKPAASTQAKPKSIMKQASTASLTAKAVTSATKTTKAVPGSSKGKTAASSNDEDLDDRPPSKVIQSQMAARVQSQVQASKQFNGPPPMASELIELPEPNSEYSDSDDEGRQRGFDAPQWAQSPELRQALETQSTYNPDNIFGPVMPLRMEDLFRTRHSRFRARTSSANWSGPDGLTQEEDREYARRMGFR